MPISIFIAGTPTNWAKRWLNMLHEQHLKTVLQFWMDFVGGGMSDGRAYRSDFIEIFMHISDEP